MKKYIALASLMLGFVASESAATAHENKRLNLNATVIGISDDNFFKDVTATISALPHVERISGQNGRVLAVWRIQKQIGVRSIEKALESFKLEGIASYQGRAKYGKAVPLEIGEERTYLRSVTYSTKRIGQTKREESFGSAFTGIRVSVLPKMRNGSPSISVEQSVSALNDLYRRADFPDRIQGVEKRVTKLSAFVPKDNDAVAYLTRGIGEGGYVLTVLSAGK